MVDFKVTSFYQSLPARQYVGRDSVLSYTSDSIWSVDDKRYRTRGGVFGLVACTTLFGLLFYFRAYLSDREFFLATIIVVLVALYASWRIATHPEIRSESGHVYACFRFRGTNVRWRKILLSPRNVVSIEGLVKDLSNDKMGDVYSVLEVVIETSATSCVRVLLLREWKKTKDQELHSTIEELGRLLHVAGLPNMKKLVFS